MQTDFVSKTSSLVHLQSPSTPLRSSALILCVVELDNIFEKHFHCRKCIWCKQYRGLLYWFFNMCMLGHPCWVYAKSRLVNRATIVSYFDAFYFHKKVLPLLLCEIHEQWKANTWLPQPECFNRSGYHFLQHLLHSPTASYNQQIVSLV